MCVEGEDAYYTRRHAVLTPIRDYADQAFDVLLPSYGIKKSAERMQAFDTRYAAEK